MGRLLIIPVALLLLLAGAIVWSGGGVEKRADFAFINRGDIYTLDLNQMSYMQDFRLTYAIREGLYGLDPKTYAPVPGGATHFDLSEDKKVWTFHLRPQCLWSNGDPVTVRDYVFSWLLMLQEPGEYTYLISQYIEGAAEYQKRYEAGETVDPRIVGAEALDDLTLRVKLINPVPYLLDLLAFPPFYPRHEKSMEPFREKQPGGRYSYRADYTRPPAVVTNGPFILKRWDFKRRLILEKSPNYWDRDQIKLQRIENVVNDNPLTQFLQYDAGAVDWLAEVLGEIGAELKAKGRKDLMTSPAFGTMFLSLMCRPNLPQAMGGAVNPLADVRVRQALAMSIDKRIIVQTITRMNELPARTYLPPDGTLRDFTFMPGPVHPGRSQNYTAAEVRQILTSPDGLGGPGPGLPFDLQAARQKLAEAGYPDGKGFPSLPILFNSDNPQRRKIVQRVSNEWRTNLNIDIRIEEVEGKIFQKQTKAHEFAIATTAWYGDYPDASTFTDKYLTSSLNNEAAWEVSEYDNLCAQAAKEPDAAKRMRLLEQAENMIDTQVPVIPLYHYTNVALINPRVRGLDTNPRNLIVYKAISVEH